jgi:hypothetical protein
VYKQTLGRLFCKPRGVRFFRLFLLVAERKVSMNFKKKRKKGQCYIPRNSAENGLSFGIFLGSLEHPGFANTSISLSLSLSIQSCRSLQYLCKCLKSSPKTRDHVRNDHVTILDVDIQKLAFDSPSTRCSCQNL